MTRVPANRDKPQEGDVRDKASIPDTEQGVCEKYDVKRLNDPDGKHDKCPMYVLDLKHDPYARTALEAYALACEREYPKLADDLREWVSRADGLAVSKHPGWALRHHRLGRLHDLIADRLRKALTDG